MNRRHFAVSLLTLPLAATFPLIGCNTDTVATFVNTIAKYAAQLATYFGQSGYAGQITALATQVAADIQGWQAGSPVTDAITALNDLADLVNLIPAAGPYVMLIDLILAAITGLLALLPSSAVLTVQMSVAEHTAKLRAKGVIRRVAAPAYFKDFSKKSMTTANNDFVANWTRLTVSLPTTK
jgi:hypothetical protein